MLLGEANRETPAQAELRPTCVGFSASDPFISRFAIVYHAHSRILRLSTLIAAAEVSRLLFRKLFAGKQVSLAQEKLCKKESLAPRDRDYERSIINRIFSPALQEFGSKHSQKSCAGVRG
jgi:hypothetical protein